MCYRKQFLKAHIWIEFRMKNIQVLDVDCLYHSIVEFPNQKVLGGGVL